MSPYLKKNGHLFVSINSSTKSAEYQISKYSPVGTPGYGIEYQIFTYSHVGTSGYRNEYQISTYYYIDRCELWGFIREINCGISHVKCVFPPELLLRNYKCGGSVPCCVTANTHTIVN
jgi:hypothetical protein